MLHTFSLLCALNHPATLNHADGPTMIAGLSAAVLEQDIGTSPEGFIRPRADTVMENCGMGGDDVTTANISCLAAFIAATAGATICKHGSPSNTDEGRCGSSDFLHALDIDLQPQKHVLEACIDRFRFGYVEALDGRYKLIHLQTHKAIRLPHMNHLLGPMTSPVHPLQLTRRVMGVNAHIEPETVAKAFHILNERGVTNLEHGIFLRGYANEDRTRCIDELSVCPGGSHIAELHNGHITSYDVLPEDLGVNTVPEEAIAPPANMSKRDFSTRILNGEISGPAIDMVCANAGLLLKLLDPSLSARDSTAEAKRIFSTGKPAELAHNVAQFLRDQRALQTPSPLLT